MDKGMAEHDTPMDFVDNLITDEVERAMLQAKPTCFLIIGKPGIGKSTLAKNIAESWKCILIDDTDLVNTHIRNETKEGLELIELLSEGRSLTEEKVLQLILDRLNSSDVEHYGYVLSCLPFMSEDCMEINEQVALIQNLKLTPDFIINIKYADKDLTRRLSGLKQHPEEGQLRKDSMDEDMEEKEDQTAEDGLQKAAVDQMVWMPENLSQNAFTRIKMYKDTVLKPLEDYMVAHNPLYLMELDGHNTPEELHASVMARLGSMAIKRVSIPILLHQADEDFPEYADPEDLLRNMSSTNMVAPGFRWRRSRWGNICPVALKDGRIVPGISELTVGFEDKMYILSSPEAYQKFVTNPRQYLLPPMPRPPCKVSIIGPPQSGKSTLCQLLAKHYNALVLYMEELVEPVLAKTEQERLDKVKEETTQVVIEQVTKMVWNSREASDDSPLVEVTEDHPQVKAMVLSALQEAKQQSISSVDLYADVLKTRVKQIEEADEGEEFKTGWVLDNFPDNLSKMESLHEGEILPDIIFCLKDSSEHKVLERMYKKNKESVDEAVNKRVQNEQPAKVPQASEKSEKEADKPPKLETIVEEKEENSEQSESRKTADPGVTKQKAVSFPDQFELTYPDGPEMIPYKEQLQEFVAEWDQMLSSLHINYLVLEIERKSPEDLLQEMIFHMEKPFEYVPRELSGLDMDEEEEDIAALAELKENDEDDSDTNEGDTTFQRSFGDTHHFCPVALRNENVLWPCKDKIAAKYREKIFYFSSKEAREDFLDNPTEFLAKNEPLKPPALRIFSLGTRGSGKTSHGTWVAEQLGLFHIQFREHLQKLIMAKTNTQVTRSDEVETDEALEDLEALIMEAREEANLEEEEEEETEKEQEEEKEKEKEKEEEDNNASDNEEVELTAEEAAIRAYLSDGEPLTPEILDRVLTPFWKEEPYLSTGFILEGFPHNPDEVQYMREQQFFPDATVTIKVDVKDVQSHLLPAYLEKWRERRDYRKTRRGVLSNLRKINRDKKIARRRAEIKADMLAVRSQDDEEGNEEEEADYGIMEEIEAMLGGEFPDQELVEDDIEDQETATEKLEKDIRERFINDEEDLATILEQLYEQNIPDIFINGSYKPPTVRKQLLQRLQPLLTNRESLFQTCQPITSSLAKRLLLFSYKLHSAFGCWDPIKLIEKNKEDDLIQPLKWPLRNTYPLIFSDYIYFFESKDNRNTFMRNPLKYLRQPKPTPSLPVKLAVIGPPKAGKTSVAQMFSQKYGLARLSLGRAVRIVLGSQGNTDLVVQMKQHLLQGLVVPDELAIQCLEVVLLSPVCTTQGYVLDGFPMTMKQTELLSSRSIIPMVVTEIELDTVDMLKRGHMDKIKPNRPHLKFDSCEITHTHSSTYKRELEQVKKYFRQQYQNWIVLNGLRSKWWIFNSIVREVSISSKYIHSFLERTLSGQAACINRMCITPQELQQALGEFGQYCPVCLALYYHFGDCSDDVSLTHVAQYQALYYKTCGQEHLEMFLSTPDPFLPPDCPHGLPPAHLLPRKLSEKEMKNKYPQKVALKGFCPVTYLTGEQRYEALVYGKPEHAVEYKELIYIFQSKMEQDMFMRNPEMYCNQTLPDKVPPVIEHIPLTSLPTLGYLRQGVAQPIIKALTAVGCLKPKYPFLSIERSALNYVAFYLKAFNKMGSEGSRGMYKEKLASFEEDNTLIPFLASTMRGNYKPPSERPADFQSKMTKFLALEKMFF